MPVIKVYGVPENVGEDMLRRITDSLAVDVSLIEELKLEAEQVAVFFPTDRMKWSLGEEIIAFVDGLFCYPARTYRVKASVAMAICRILKDYFPSALLVECFVTMFDPYQGGFYSIRKGDEKRGD